MSAAPQTQDVQLDAATQRELQDFLAQEQAKAKVQQSIHTFTDTCWDLCMANSSIGARFSSSEGRCLENCVDRYLDVSKAIVNHVQQKQGGH